MDEVFARPLGEEEAKEYDRDQWGLSDEAILAAQAKDTLWGDVTYN